MRAPAEPAEFDIFKTMGCLYDDKAYAELKRLCRDVLRSPRADAYQLHIALSFKALAMIETHQYAAAVKSGKRALELCPTCPWARYAALYAYEAHADASKSQESLMAGLELGQQILADGYQHIATDPCTDKTPARAKRGYLNDTRFLLAYLYIYCKDFEIAAALLAEYVENYPASRNNFTKQEALETLQSIASS